MPPSYRQQQQQRSAWAAINSHVQQWINLVLCHNIYQNAVLLYLYKFFKWIYGFYTQTTELSRICSAVSPVDELWHEDGIITEQQLPSPHLRLRTDNLPVTNHRRQSSTFSTDSNNSPTSTGSSSPLAGNDHDHDSSSPLPPYTRDIAEDQHHHPASVLRTNSAGSEKGRLDQSPMAELDRVTLKKRPSSPSPKTTTTSASAQGASTVTIVDGQPMDRRQSKAAAEMVYRIDRCILFSKHLTVERRELELAECDPVAISNQILRKKRFPEQGSIDTLAARKLQYSLCRIASTHQLARAINQRIHTKYDSTNPTHERKLMQLWNLLQPNEKLTERYTKQWTNIGFQGKDPATDFRGMGMLGLDDLVYYAKKYPQSSGFALESSQDDVSWYSFAIVGINITAFAVQTLRTRQLQYYLFLNGTERTVYHEFYCYLYHSFNSYWVSLDPKPNVMEFERIFADFKAMTERQLVKRKPMKLTHDTRKSLWNRPPIPTPTSTASAAVQAAKATNLSLKLSTGSSNAVNHTNNNTNNNNGHSPPPSPTSSTSSSSTLSSTVQSTASSRTKANNAATAETTGTLATTNNAALKAMTRGKDLLTRSWGALKQKTYASPITMDVKKHQ